MALVLTDGKTRIGAFRLPDRKRPGLGVQKGNTVAVYGYLKDDASAEEFMYELCRLVRAETDLKRGIECVFRNSY